MINESFNGYILFEAMRTKHRAATLSYTLYFMRPTGLKGCPYSAELIKLEALVSRHCGREISLRNLTITNLTNETYPQSTQDGKPASNHLCPKCGIPMEIRVTTTDEQQGLINTMFVQTINSVNSFLRLNN